jgi:ribosome-binding protein aMBF1 (putative translation factor)
MDSNGWTVVTNRRKELKKKKKEANLINQTQTQTIEQPTVQSNNVIWSDRNSTILPNIHLNVKNTDDTVKVKVISLEFRQALTNARVNKNLTRQQLAEQINEQESVIKNYENGTTIANNNIIQKINKVLGITLPKLKKIEG